MRGAKNEDRGIGACYTRMINNYITTAELSRLNDGAAIVRSKKMVENVHYNVYDRFLKLFRRYLDSRKEAYPATTWYFTGLLSIIVSSFSPCFTNALSLISGRGWKFACALHVQIVILSWPPHIQNAFAAYDFESSGGINYTGDTLNCDTGASLSEPHINGTAMCKLYVIGASLNEPQINGTAVHKLYAI
jgi:hypothetical protein